MPGRRPKLSDWQKIENELKVAFGPPEKTPQDIQMYPSRVKSIRRFAAGDSLLDFQRRFGLPARTVEGWEQGRRIDAAGRVLLKIIESDPVAAELAIWTSSRGSRRRR